MKQIKLNLSRTALICLVLFLSGCAYGGGTIGTGITGYGNKSAKVLKLKYRVIALVKDSANKPVSGMRLGISNSIMQSDKTTDTNGKAEINVVAVSGENLMMTFEKSGVKRSCSVFVSPAGEDQIQLNFRLKGSNEVICP